jgi:opacity protein-like surface antigen
MMRISILALVVSLLVVPAGVFAQGVPDNSYKVEAFGSVGWAGLFRLDDSTSFGSSASPGAGIGVRLFKGLGLEVDVHGLRTRGESVRSGMAVSTNAAYHFSTRHQAVQPYLLGGVGMLRTHYSASTSVNPQAMTELTDTGWGVSVGGGVRVFLTPRVSLRPEVRYVGTLWRSKENLSETRAAALVAYHW